MSKNILITGATGLIGKHLIPELQKQGHHISILARKNTALKNVKVYLWDIEQQTIDPAAFEGIDTVIHLAGEGIADKRWTAERKKEIVDSRIKSAHLLYKTIHETKAKVSTFISASAVGYYGNRGDEFLWEDSEPGKGFLAKCCVLWEKAADEGLNLGIRVVKIRLGIILSGDGGALPAMAKPIKLFVGAPLGSGKQWVPWIHIHDVVGIFAQAVTDQKMHGAYHATAPYPSSNKVLTHRIAYWLSRPVWPINVPRAILKMVMGESSTMVLMSSNTSAKKTVDAGYEFQYTDLDKALKEIYR